MTGFRFLAVCVGVLIGAAPAHAHHAWAAVFTEEYTENLAEPFSTTIEWVHAPQLEMASFGCELREARRFLGT